MTDDETDKLELIHEITTGALRRQVERFHSTERKVWRHAALLGLVLTVLSVGGPRALSAYQSGGGLVVWIFAVSYTGAVVAAFWGVFCFVMAMRYEVLGVDPMKEGFVDENLEKGYRETLESLSRGAVDTYLTNKQAFGPKERWSRWGWWALVVAVPTSALALIMYTLLRGG